MGCNLKISKKCDGNRSSPLDTTLATIKLRRRFFKILQKNAAIIYFRWNKICVLRVSCKKKILALLVLLWTHTKSYKMQWFRIGSIDFYINFEQKLKFKFSSALWVKMLPKRNGFSLLFKVELWKNQTLEIFSFQSNYFSFKCQIDGK